MSEAAIESPTPELPVGPTSDHDSLAKPLQVQRVERALELDPLLNYVEAVLNIPDAASDSETTDTEPIVDSESEGLKTVNGVTTTKAERRADKMRLYNFSKVKKSRKWLKSILLSDSSSDEDEEPISQQQLHEMLKVHRLQKKYQTGFHNAAQQNQYQYFSVGLLSLYDKYPEIQKQIAGPKKKEPKDPEKKMEKKMKAKLKKLKKAEKNAEVLRSPIGLPTQTMRVFKVKRLTPEQALAKRKKLWISIVKKEIPKAQKQRGAARKEMTQNAKKLAKECLKERKRQALQYQQTAKGSQQRGRRLMREMVTYWKRFEKVEKEHRRKAEKEAQEQRKIDIELREARRQQRKLNFLITQTELFAHFVSSKIGGPKDAVRDKILQNLDEGNTERLREVDGGMLTDMNDDGYDEETMKKMAIQNATDALSQQRQKTEVFDREVVGKKAKHAPLDKPGESSFANPTLDSDKELPQPSIFVGKLKHYQLKGMNWLGGLYDKGINGILADEMGLGKTVQSIAFLAHLAEYQGIWGPFLVIAPASTLHNWQQEVTRFVPKFKVVPYWGTTQERRILRQFWDQKHLHSEEASFHLVITSYQLVVQDMKYFQKIKWHYLVLDEAQAIKSSSSVRWKLLLQFHCRNRLLLTGTPIQNSMAELWALLHFIMPTLFDSHDEFNEWFSKDIESHAEKNTGVDENQLSRLHMILKPFMLRRVKKDVENELSDKIEILVYCPLTMRQKLLYQAIKNKIRIEDLVQSASSSSTAAANSLMNLVMQFRKVCNHPELFERREVKSPYYMKLEPYVIPKTVFREGLLDSAIPSHQRIKYSMLYIFSQDNIHESLQPKQGNKTDSCFSFTRFINMSPQELNSIMLAGLLVRWLALFLWLKEAYRIYHQRMWQKENEIIIKSLDNKAFLLEPSRTTYFTNVGTSQSMRELVFANHSSSVHGFADHVHHYIPETHGHRKVRLLNASARLLAPPMSPTKKTPVPLPPKSPTKKMQSQPLKSPSALDIDSPLVIHKHVPRPPKVQGCQLTELPGFLYYSIPKVNAGLTTSYCNDRSAEWFSMKQALCGTLDARNSLLYGTPEIKEQVQYHKWYFYPTQPSGLLGITPKHGYSQVYVPDKETLVTDAGKLFVLDSLLARLKEEDHRVLIYSQMTRVIDLLEEYMWHRKHTYMRLDGSSKISDRRDMVADFQTRSDIFVFLLSTRAGGLGINLTAADTVIFYDSDWNPTVDQQAMDRAHRLGQTKQVTVYRLICKGTIEERILQRAKEKSEIQRMVISGGSFKPDHLKAKEVVSLLLDDEEMERKLRQKAEEKKHKEEKYKEKDRKRKRDQYAKKKQETGKRKKTTEEVNVTIPADTESLVSYDSASAAASPLSVVSAGSEAPLVVDENSSDALVIDDTAPIVSSTPPPPTTGKGRGSGRGRGRPKGSVGRPRGRGIKKTLTAAEIAGAQAGKTAAYAAYGYNFAGKGSKDNN